MEQPHILVPKDRVKTVPFVGPSSTAPLVPEKDRSTQGRMVRDSYLQSIQQFKAQRDASEIPEDKKSTGFYLELNAQKDINWDSLDTTKGPKLLNVKSNAEGNGFSTTLFLDEKRQGWLTKRVDDYENPEKDKSSHPSNRRLINNIVGIESAHVLNLFSLSEERDKFSCIPNELEESYEIWIDKDTQPFDQEDLFSRLEAIGIVPPKSCLKLPRVIITLITTTKDKLEKLIYAVNNLSEIRFFREASVLLAANLSEQAFLAELLKKEIQVSETNVRIGILDSGVRNSHPLLSGFLPNDRCLNATSVSLQDRCNHGTLMAGLALYGDLTDHVYAIGPLTVNSDLCSVKIMPGRDEAPNDRELYGVIAEDAIIQAREAGAMIQCSAVTADSSTVGEASSWSSAIDETLFNDGKADSLLFVSAGNVEETDGQPYPDFNITAQVRDPAQSWNAITVGAYTNRCVINDPNYCGINPIVSRGELSPYSTTSVLWTNGLVKPEILMEGGNAIENGGKLSAAPDNLNLVSTSAKASQLFDAIWATSAATALAAKLAAEIKNRNPSLSPLAIRALMIHSAEWTQEMKDRFLSNGGKMHLLLHSCGYGVPNSAKATVSQDSYATFIVEQEIVALRKNKDGKGYKYNFMHLIDLPWPKDVLQSMEDQTVRLKVTLSYYVQPAPGSKSRLSKYRYPSLQLRFDVNKPTEDEASFKQRVSRVKEEGVDVEKNDAARWGIGIKERNHGSVISDFIETTPSEMAMCNLIAVYPSGGWWKGLKYSGDMKIKYSLVVSLEVNEADIYTPIKNQIEQRTEVSV